VVGSHGPPGVAMALDLPGVVPRRDESGDATVAKRARINAVVCKLREVQAVDLECADVPRAVSIAGQGLRFQPAFVPADGAQHLTIDAVANSRLINAIGTRSGGRDTRRNHCKQGGEGRQDGLYQEGLLRHGRSAIVAWNEGPTPCHPAWNLGGQQVLIACWFSCMAALCCGS